MLIKVRSVAALIFKSAADGYVFIAVATEVALASKQRILLIQIGRY